jgi:hypothetical protein
MGRGSRIAVLVFANLGQAACASTPLLEPGLANAPALPQSQTIDVHDAIANGRDSCPRARIAAGDPLRFHYPPCPGRETVPPVTLLAASVRRESPASGLWNLNLQGFPPCEGAAAARSGGTTPAVCRFERPRATGIPAPSL